MPLIGRYPGWWKQPSSPSRPLVQGSQWQIDESGVLRHVHLPLRGQRRLGWPIRLTLLLPVELRHVNHTASTNASDFTAESLRQPYNRAHMSNPSQIEQLVERVERLLLRYVELQRTNELLTDQIDELTTERDQLKSRLTAARTRVDALLERLSEPAESDGSKDAT